MTNRTLTSSSLFRAIDARRITAIAAAVAASAILAACGGSDGCADAAATGKSALPKSTAKAANNGSIFYGMNGHNSNGGAYDETSAQTQLAQLQDMGATIYRNDVYNQASANLVAKVAKTMTEGGVTMYPVLLMSFDYNSEQDAYNAGYTLGQQTANSYRYQYYEVGNELESHTLNGTISTA